MNHEREELGFDLPAPAQTSRVRIVIVLVVLAGGLFAFGYSRRSPPGEAPIARQSGIPHVETSKPKVLTSDSALSLPGVVRALEETKIYPHTAGYIKRWLVDIGDKVSEGQLLAEIAAPDVDAQLAQARAQLAQANAALKQAAAQAEYSKANADRNVSMAQQQLVAKATVEQAVAQAKADAATVAADEANIASMDANVHRLTELVAYEKVTAPFAGTITTRTIERGQLVGDTTTASTATPMFTLAATDPVRVFVDVPQTVATSVQTGTPAEITVRELGERTFAGKVSRSAGELDADLHTMSTEIRVPNPDGALLPGMYVQAAIELPVPHHVVEIPATALYSDAQGTRVAVVTPQHTAHFVPITIERDTGATLWIASGLTGDEHLITIAVPTLGEGDAVEATEARPPGGSAAH
ncbi:MAG TPA: efflux RND transporter periplasmic adaptor subunit [Kofleriaceae bacterium]|nr:efflux RND transporter periplasmic adaptor subunit [Kofleriaceae bacterium]